MIGFSLISLLNERKIWLLSAGFGEHNEFWVLTSAFFFFFFWFLQRGGIKKKITCVSAFSVWHRAC